MKKRKYKKTQKQLGYVSVGAWVRPGLYDALARLAAGNRTSLTAELTAAIEAHVKEKTA